MVRVGFDNGGVLIRVNMRKLSKKWYGLLAAVYVSSKVSSGVLSVSVRSIFTGSIRQYSYVDW